MESECINSFQSLKTYCQIAFPQSMHQVSLSPTIRWLTDPDHLKKKHNSKMLFLLVVGILGLFHSSCFKELEFRNRTFPKLLFLSGPFGEGEGDFS